MHARVAKMYYRVSYPDQTKLVSDEAPETSTMLGGFVCTVNPKRLIVVPTDEYRDVDTAREVLDPLLRAWEAKTELLDGYPLKFDYEDADFEVVDPPPNTTVALAGVASITASAGQVTAHLVRRDVPLPDVALQSVGPLTEQLRRRFQNMREGRELVTGFAYYLYTALEEHLGGIKPAADALLCSVKVLGQLRKLASTEDEEHGRKVGGHPGELTAMDIMWLRNTCRILVGRVLQYEAGVRDTQLLTLADLKLP